VRGKHVASHGKYKSPSTLLGSIHKCPLSQVNPGTTLCHPLYQGHLIHIHSFPAHNPRSTHRAPRGLMSYM
jgi:hypothetical protein